jgi:hypothetical protein
LFEKEAVRFQLSVKKLFSDSDGEMNALRANMVMAASKICLPQLAMES